MTNIESRTKPKPQIIIVKDSKKEKDGFVGYSIGRNLTTQEAARWFGAGSVEWRRKNGYSVNCNNTIITENHLGRRDNTRWFS